RPNSAPYFHPVRQARLIAGDTPVAWVGEVHPLVLRAFDVTPPVAAVVLHPDPLLAAAPSEPPAYEDLLTVPVSTRDIAVAVPEGTRSADLVAAAREAGAPLGRRVRGFARYLGGARREAGAPLVRSVRVFDRYAGEQVEEGSVSLALRLELADPGRTLTDE